MSMASSALSAAAVAARSVLEQHVEAGYGSGLVALIGAGEDAEVIAVGRQSRDSGEPMHRDSLFRIASMTKPITALAALMLAEQRRVSLDGPVESWLPELGNRRVLRRLDGVLEDTVPARRSITVRDLLSMRPGLGIVLAPPGTYPIQRKIEELKLLGFGPPDPGSPLTSAQWLQRLGTLPLMAQPGECWMYNTGSYILGVLVERVCGRPLPQCLHERILAPLGMANTGFFVPPERLSRLTSLYRGSAEAYSLVDPAAASQWSVAPVFPDGGAGLVSTVDDYFAFSRLLLDRGRIGGRQFVSERTIEAMTTDHLTSMQRRGGRPILAEGAGWGFGLAVMGRGNALELPDGAYGWAGGLGTTWYADPHTGRTAILLTTVMFESPEPPAVHREFRRAVFR